MQEDNAVPEEIKVKIETFAQSTINSESGHAECEITYKKEYEGSLISLLRVLKLSFSLTSFNGDCIANVQR